MSLVLKKIILEMNHIFGKLIFTTNYIHEKKVALNSIFNKALFRLYFYY